MLGHHVRRAHLSLWRQFNEHVAHGGLRPGQLGVLAAVERQPGISQTDLSRELDLDKTTIVSLVLLLEKEGWIRRARAASDRRRHELTITMKGKSKLRKLQPALDRHEANLRKLFSQKEYSQLVELLQRIYLDPKG